jgi:NADH-quinone oxidoreductase subunit J
MDLYSFFIYLFSFMSIVFAIFVIAVKNAVHSAIFLIFTILSIAGIFFMLNAEFLGAVQILVYAGGIMVIYLFIIFLIKLEEVGGKRRNAFLYIVSSLILLLVAGEIVYLLIKRASYPFPPPTKFLDLKTFSDVLLKNYVIPFELASLLLIGAMIATIYLARKRT